MASRKENLKALFSNTRSRVIIIFTAALLIAGMLIGFYKIMRIETPSIPSSASISGAPPIGSVPGSLNPTVQYAALQQTQNIDQAKQAIKTGRSAIPTIIRTQTFGQGVSSVGAQGGKGGVGFETLARENLTGDPSSLWIQSLKNSNCDKQTVEKVISQGAVLNDLRKACSCDQLKHYGYNLSQLNSVCTCIDLKRAGYNASQLKAIGYTAERLRICGYSACQLKAAGFTAQEMKDGGYTDGELKGAGFPESDILKSASLPEGITPQDVLKAGCSQQGLEKLREAGVTALAIRQISGCSVEALKAAGYSAKELKNAGFTAAQLKNAGFTPEELAQAGYSPRSLLNAGFTPEELARAGFSPSEIKDAELALPPGVTTEEIKHAGCSVGVLEQEREAGISATLIREYANCSARALKNAGFTASDLANAGFNAQQLKEAGFTPQQLLAAGFSPEALKGMVKPSLLPSGISPEEVKRAGCDPNKLRGLRERGVTAEAIRQINGCSLAALKAAGYNAEQLKDAGFSPQQLLNAGFTPEQVEGGAGVPLLPPGITPAEVKAAGCDSTNLSALRERGVSAEAIRLISHCSLEALKNAGYSVKQISSAGFTPQQLLNAGFTPQQLINAGLDPSAAIAAGRSANCDIGALKAARTMGVSAATIRETLGCNASELKKAGYTAAQLKDAGFTAAELKNAGFTAAQLKNAGFSAKQLKDAGFSAAELKAAGFDAQALKDAGFTASELKNAGFSASELKNAGFSAKQLKDAGFTASELKNAGFTAGELKAAGFNASELKNAGFDASQLKQAGFTENELRNAGFSPQALQNAGFDTSGINQGNAPLPSVDTPNGSPQSLAQAKANQELQKLLTQQQQEMAKQRYQQAIDSRTNGMAQAAGQLIQSWKSTSAQVYVAGNNKEEGEATLARSQMAQSAQSIATTGKGVLPSAPAAILKTGDIVFAVIDTAINSDEPGPILATIVSGKLSGTTLIGSFNLPSNADKMVISFNTMSVPGQPHSVGISAYAIDPETARTALASTTNHHYLARYGALFASTFLEGFGNAFQSANTTITIGGTGGMTNTTIQNGVGRSILENAVIGLATVGKSWGQVAQQEFNRPTTVQVCSGTPIGVLFTQDVTTL